MNHEIKITFTTPCFCRGADCSETGMPEIRPSSIRGQLHWWFRALGGTPQDENAIFGSIHGGAKASPLIVRVKYAVDISTVSSPTLPHKTGGPAALKKAIAPNVPFDLLISTRLGGLSPDLEKKFTRALDAWLHLGALGLRATRGGGNFTWDGAPQTPDAYKVAIANITTGTKLHAALLDNNYKNAEDARRVITDTLDDKAFGGSAPLGKAIGGRKTSPLRFRIVKFDATTFNIVAIWDGRNEVTDNTDADLRTAIQKLDAAKKPIGIQLAASTLTH
jgi:CRISPR/Cas system CMR-associated protein Cmr1 (group 7 of RAMP superfamily)